METLNINHVACDGDKKYKYQEKVILNYKCLDLLNGTKDKNNKYENKGIFYSTFTSNDDSLKCEFVTTYKEQLIDINLNTKFKLNKNFIIDVITQNAKSLSFKILEKNVLLKNLDIFGTLAIPLKAPSKIGLNYKNRHFQSSITSTVSLAPDIHLAFKSTIHGFLANAKIDFSILKKSFVNYAMGFGFANDKNSINAQIQEKAKLLKVSYVRKYIENSSFGIEIEYPIQKHKNKEILCTVGWERNFSPSNSILKCKLDSKGFTSILYNTKLSQNEDNGSISISSQFDANDLTKMPKLGITYQL